MRSNKPIKFYFIIYFFLMISHILCVYRQEAYKFFDKFNLVDIVS